MLAAPWLTAALVLVVSGLGKVWRPAGAAKALRTLAGAAPGAGGDAAATRNAAATRHAFAARALGLSELALAAWCAAAPGRASAAALAAAYLVFAAVAVVLRRRAPDSDCGCFGAASARPVSRVHVAANLAGAAVGLAALASPPALPHLAALPLATFVAAVAASAWAAVLVYTELPGGAA